MLFNCNWSVESLLRGALCTKLVCRPAPTVIGPNSFFAHSGADIISTPSKTKHLRARKAGTLRMHPLSMNLLSFWGASSASFCEQPVMREKKLASGMTRTKRAACLQERFLFRLASLLNDLGQMCELSMRTQMFVVVRCLTILSECSRRKIRDG